MKNKNIKSNFITKYRQLPQPVRASVWFAGCSFLQRGISVITTPIFTRLLSNAEYGQFGVFNSWKSIISCIVTLNLFSGLFMQGLVKFETERERFASAIQGLCTVLITVWAFIYFLFRDFWNQLFSLTTVQVLSMLLMIWCSAMFNFWSTKQRVDYQYCHLVIITLFVTIASPAVSIFLVLHAEDKVTARILGVTLIELLAYSWIFFAQMKRNRTFFAGKFWFYALAFNIPLIPHYLSSSVLGSADRIMIQNMVGDAEAGLYTLAYSVSQIMEVFNIAVLQTMEPWLYKRIKKRETDVVSSMAYPIFCSIALINLALIAFAPEIIAVFAPPSYYNAIWVVPPAAMGVFFFFLYSFFATFEFYYEKTQYIAFATMASAVLNIVLNAIFIPLCGYIAAGYTTLACYITYALFHYIFMCRLCDQRSIPRVYSLKWLLCISFLFMVTGFVLLSTYLYALLRYSIVAVALILLYFQRRKVSAIIKNLLVLKKET